MAAAACAVDVARAMDGQPTQQIVHVEVNGTLTLTAQISKPVYETIQRAYTVMVPYQETRLVEENGVQKEVTVTVQKPETKTATVTVCKHVCVMMCSPLDHKTAKGFEVDGRRIPAAELARRLTDQSLVVVSAMDGMIPDYYASIYKPGTVILALPAPSSLPLQMPTPGPTRPQFVPPPPGPLSDAPVPGLIVQPVAFQAPAQIAAPAGSVPAAPIDSAFPNTPAPLIVFATRSGADDLKIRQLVETPSEGELTVRANDSAVAPEVVMKVQRLTRHSETTVVPLKALRFSSSEARDIATDRIKERFGAGETTVLISADGQPVDDFWLQNIQSKVPVLRGVKLPPVSTNGGAMPPMAYPPMPAPVPAAPLPPPTAP